MYEQAMFGTGCLGCGTGMGGAPMIGHATIIRKAPTTGLVHQVPVEPQIQTLIRSGADAGEAGGVVADDNGTLENPPGGEFQLNGNGGWPWYAWAGIGVVVLGGLGGGGYWWWKRRQARAAGA